MAFAAVARVGSLRRLAALLDLKPSTLSHLVRSPENPGTKPLSRSVSTHVRLASSVEVSPALAGALDAINPYRTSPRESLRLTMPPLGEEDGGQAH